MQYQKESYHYRAADADAAVGVGVVDDGDRADCYWDVCEEDVSDATETSGGRDRPFCPRRL